MSSMEPDSDSRHSFPDEQQSSHGDRGKSRDPFISQVEAGIEIALSKAADTELEGPGETTRGLLLALSGGPDSTALLLALAELSRETGRPLAACHVNHHLRGAESDADEQFCKELSARHSIPLHVRHIFPEKPGQASEAELREARYAMLCESAGSANAGFIVLGHTLDDQVETFLFRLLRGTGPQGLISMEPARYLDPALTLLRPMLAIRRDECAAFLERRCQAARADSSNESTIYNRNYIRLCILPVIRQRFAGFEERLENLRHLIEEDEVVLGDLTAGALGKLESGAGCGVQRWSLERFQLLPVSLKRRTLAAALKTRGIEVSFDRIAAILDIGTGGALSLNERWDIRFENGYIRWVDKDMKLRASPNSSGGQLEVRIPGLTISPLSGRALQVEVFQPEQGRMQCAATNEAPLSYPESSSSVAFVDLERAAFPLVIRTRLAGDTIRPFGMEDPVKLKKYLHNKKLDTSERRALILIADQEEVLWIPGVGLSNKIKVTGRPSHRLTWLEIAPDENTFC